MNQLSLALRNDGIDRAVTHANDVHDSWSDTAFDMLREYIHTVQRFKNEDFRSWAAAHGLPTPPSLRAYGGIITKAKKEGLIESIGVEKVSNPAAHCAFASIWIRKK